MVRHEANQILFLVMVPLTVGSTHLAIHFCLSAVYFEHGEGVAPLAPAC